MTQKMTKIQILGKEYTVNCPPGQGEHLRQVAAELASRLADTQKKSMLQSNENILVMTALNMANDLLEQKNQLDLIHTDKKRKTS
jgi:cell division protein ZapA